MKRILSTLLLVVLSATLVPAVYAQGGCTDATLTGNYAFNLSGFASPVTPKRGAQPWAVTGVLNLDGAGNISASYAGSINGGVFTAQTTSGTYTVNSDCTGSVAFTSGDDAGGTYNIVIIGGGTEVFILSTQAHTTATGDAKKQ
jgi:hypothetical protein